MFRSVSAIALLALAPLAFGPEAGLAQGRGDRAATAGFAEAASPAASDAAPGVPGTATNTTPSAALSFPRSALRYLPSARTGGERGIEDATTGVWVGALTGVVAGGLIASWAYCGLGEGDCGFSITAAGPGMLIGGILGASIGGLLDQDGDADPSGAPAHRSSTYHR